MEARIKAAKNLSNRVRLNKNNWPTPVAYLGGGVYGRVFVTNNGRLMKIQKFNATKEFNILRSLRSTGMVPKVKNGNIYKLKLKSSNKNITRELGYGSKPINSLNMFIMNRVGTMTLKQYIRVHPPSKNYDKYIQNYVRWLVHRLQMAGIEHGNLHRENIIVSVDSKGKITGMWLIDFGKSKYHNIVPPHNLTSYMKMYRYNYNPNTNVKLRPSPRRSVGTKKTRSVPLRMARSVQ
jgi:hypothetical protein